MVSPYFVAMLCFGMLFTGTINTLLNKLQDLSCVANCDDPNNKKHYEQPVWQTLNMFIGESMCLLVYYASLFIKRYSNQYEPIPTNPDDDELIPSLEAAFILTPLDIPRPLLAGFSQLLFIFPTICDITATVPYATNFRL
jgi:hypothetical protein